MQKFIAIDIDGVLLPKKMYLKEDNIEVAKRFTEKKKELMKNRERVDDYLKEYEGLFYEYANDMVFDDTSIDLMNRLAEKSSGKFFVLSNWRRHLRSELLIDVLVSKGLKRELFHEKPCAPYKMKSEKIHDLYMWIDSQKLNKENSKIVVIDDDYINNTNTMEENMIIVNTHFDEGFGVNEYSKAAGFLGVDDQMFSIVQLSEEEISIVSDYIPNQSELFSFMYEIKNVSGMSYKSRANYLSKKEAQRIIDNEGDGFKFFGYSLGSFEELYASRKKSVINDLNTLYGETKPVTERILVDDLSDIEKFKISVGDFKKHPKSLPVLILGDGENGFSYVYPYKGCNDPVDYLNGYYNSLMQFDEHK